MKRTTPDSSIMVFVLVIAIIGLASTLSQPTITGATQHVLPQEPAASCAITCEPTYAGMQACLAESRTQEAYGIPNAVACVNRCCRIIPK